LPPVSVVIARPARPASIELDARPIGVVACRLTNSGSGFLVLRMGS
jgi:hypothetical protein